MYAFVVPRFRFSRLGLADVSVSVVNIAVDTTDDGVEQYALQFTVSPDTALPLAEGLANNPLPTGCSISSLELNTPSGWIMNNFSGFFLVERNSASYLEVASIYKYMQYFNIATIFFHCRSVSYQLKELRYFRLSL